MTARLPKCERCNHPKARHARGARGGCTVRVPRNIGRGRTAFSECTCVTYLDPADVSRETSPAEAAALIEADRARLAELADQGRVTLRLGGRNPGLYIDGEKN